VSSQGVRQGVQRQRRTVQQLQALVGAPHARALAAGEHQAGDVVRVDHGGWCGDQPPM